MGEWRTGRFKEVSDRRIREFLCELGFKDAVILDKSNKYRAVAFAVVNKVDGILCLAGIDDTGKTWSIVVEQDTHSYPWKDGTTVEELMAVVFGVYPSVLEGEDALLQGDVLVFPCREEEIKKKCGYLEHSPPATRIKHAARNQGDEDVRFITEWDENDWGKPPCAYIRGSHLLRAYRGVLRKIQARLIYKDRTIVEQDVFYALLLDEGTLSHKEHAPLVLPPGEYAIVPQISVFDAD